jgi:hypothetical protein
VELWRPVWPASRARSSIQESVAARQTSCSPNLSRGGIGRAKPTSFASQARKRADAQLVKPSLDTPGCGRGTQMPHSR